MGYFDSTMNVTLGDGSVTRLNVGERSVGLYIMKGDSRGAVQWVKGFNTGDRGDYGYGYFFGYGNYLLPQPAVDGSDAVYTATSFVGTTNITLSDGSITSLTSGDGRAILVLKIDATGNVLWASAFGPEGGDSSRYLYFGSLPSIAVDTSGMSYTLGTFSGNLNVPLGNGSIATLTSDNSDDIFIINSNDEGLVQWATSFSGLSYKSPTAIAVDASGSAYITGVFQGTLNITRSDGTQVTLTNSDFVLDFFVVKLNGNGELQWAKQIGDSSYTADIGSTDIAVDSSGMVYTTGSFRGIIDIGLADGSGTTLTSSTNPFDEYGTFSIDTFVIKLDSNGDVRWAKSLGGAGFPMLSTIGVDAQGSTYIASNFFGYKTFILADGSKEILASNGGNSIFLAKLDLAGSVQWARSFAGSKILMAPYAIAVDELGASYLTGFYINTMDITLENGTSATFTINVDESTLDNNGPYRYDVSGAYILKV